MFDWLAKNIDCTGSVFFRGSLPPRAEEFANLNCHGIQVSELADVDGAHWSLELEHEQWGQATLICLKDQLMPSRILIDYDATLSEDERREIGACGNMVSVRMQTRKSHILRDRKLMLYFLQAVLGDDGLAAMDHVGQRFWSRAALEDELVHDADLDIQGLYTLHAVAGGDDDDQQVRWLHTHGLAEIGFFDFDILDPSPDLVDVGVDALRALAFAIVEGKVGLSAPNFNLMEPGGEVRLVDVPTFEAHADRRYVELRDDPDADHRDRRAIVCQPAKGLFGRWSKKIKPCKFLSGQLPDQVMMRFSHEASDLMAQRAAATYSLLHHYSREFAEFEFPVIVKLGVVVDDGEPNDKEHLWFEVHDLLDDAIDATLINEPFYIERLKAGQRGMHPIELLSDWSIMTPAGKIDPRSSVSARLIRENKEQLRELVQKLKLKEQG